MASPTDDSMRVAELRQRLQAITSRLDESAPSEAQQKKAEELAKVVQKSVDQAKKVINEGLKIGYMERLGQMMELQQELLDIETVLEAGRVADAQARLAALTGNAEYQLAKATCDKEEQKQRNDKLCTDVIRSIDSIGVQFKDTIVKQADTAHLQQSTIERQQSSIEKLVGTVESQQQTISVFTTPQKTPSTSMRQPMTSMLTPEHMHATPLAVPADVVEALAQTMEKIHIAPAEIPMDEGAPVDKTSRDHIPVLKTSPVAVVAEEEAPVCAMETKHEEDPVRKTPRSARRPVSRLPAMKMTPRRKASDRASLLPGRDKDGRQLQHSSSLLAPTDDYAPSPPVTRRALRAMNADTEAASATAKKFAEKKKKALQAAAKKNKNNGTF